MTDTTNPLATYLTGVRERSEAPLTNPGSLPISHPAVRELIDSAGDVPQLLTTIEWLLRLADDWEEWAREEDGFAGHSDPYVKIRHETAARVTRDHIAAIRRTAARELLGEAGGDGTACTATVPASPLKGPPLHTVVVRPSQVEAARLLAERAAGHGEEPSSAIQAIATAESVPQASPPLVQWGALRDGEIVRTAGGEGAERIVRSMPGTTVVYRTQERAIPGLELWGPWAEAEGYDVIATQESEDRP